LLGLSHSVQGNNMGVACYLHRIRGPTPNYEQEKRYEKAAASSAVLLALGYQLLADVWHEFSSEHLFPLSLRMLTWQQMELQL